MKISSTISLICLTTQTTDAFGIVTGLRRQPVTSQLLPTPTTTTPPSHSSTCLFYGQEDDVSVFESPVLKQLYPELMKWKEEYGHPNIPLGSKEGRQCQTLRRLHIQNKLTAEEVEWLDAIGFTFHSMEDVYKYGDFDDLFERMMAYEAAHPDSNFQIPKKCPEDPELGAWVTGIRRLGKDGVNPAHERRLDSVDFVWVSQRKCGSKFMMKYRELTERIKDEGFDAIMAEPETTKWVIAQQEALKRGALSETRVHYMGMMFGDSWTTIRK